MKKSFKQLSSDCKSFSTGEHPYSRTFAGDLFKKTSWFIVNSSFNVEASFVDTHENAHAGATAKRILQLKEDILNCSMCNEEWFRERKRSYFTPSFLISSGSGVDVIFLGDFPKRLGENAVDSFSSDGGVILNRIIQAMKLKSEAYHVSYLIKCALITDHFEVPYKCFEHCKEKILLEIALLRPRVVVAFGAMATNFLLGHKEKLSKIHGQFFKHTVNISDEESYTFEFVPIFHPDLLLINPNMKRLAWMDLQKVMSFLDASS